MNDISKFMKQYKFMIIFVIALAVAITICMNNYQTIEKFTGICRNKLLLPPVDMSSFNSIQINHSTINPVTYYNYRCVDSDSTDCITGFYTGYLEQDGGKSNNLIKSIATIDLSHSATSLNDQIGECANLAATYSDPNNREAHFFTLVGSGSNASCSCNIYTLDTGSIDQYNISDNALIMNSIDISADQAATCDTILSSLINYNNHNGIDQPYKKLGVGGFTSKGYSYLQSLTGDNKDVLRYYDPLCDAESQQNNLVSEINNCIRDISNGTRVSADCESYIERYTENAAKVNNILGGAIFHTTGLNYECSGGLCISGAFQPGNYLGNMYTEFSNNTLDGLTYLTYTQSLDDYKQSLAQQEESSMETISTYMKYFMLIIVIVITLIMFFLNMTNPDIVSAEMMIGYIVFLIVIIFITSKYFNVDYGPLNRMFSVELGEAGSRVLS